VSQPGLLFNPFRLDAMRDDRAVLYRHRNLHLTPDFPNGWQRFRPSRWVCRPLSFLKSNSKLGALRANLETLGTPIGSRCVLTA